MALYRVSGAITWLLATYGLFSNARDWPPCQDISQYHRGGCCLVGLGYEDLACPLPADLTSLLPRTACITDAECSTPECAGGGRSGICRDGTCICKSPVDEYVENPAATCSTTADCSLPDCTGYGNTVVCEEGICICNGQGDDHPSKTCSADTKCSSTPGCEGDGETEACWEGKCICETEGEAAVTTTLTTIPPGASIETITDVVTENMVTTTTSDGSSDPTVVPIIVPIGKPPVVCWSCVPLPAHVQIKVPEFCVNILGLKIGNCVVDYNDDNDNDGDGDRNDADDSDDYDNDDDSDDTSDSDDDDDDGKTTSCTTTVTATYASVFCTSTGAPVAGAEDGAQRHRREEGCSTFGYSTTTACDTITGSTTTTTITEEPTELCAPETCGQGSCSLDKRAPGLARRAPPGPKSNPEAGSWFGPGNYNNRWEFMRGEVYKAYQDPTTSVNLLMSSGVMMTTGQWKAFGNEVRTVAVAGLWGCTSVIAVSKRGVWMAHFWEDRPEEVMSSLAEFTKGDSSFLDEGLGMFRGKTGDYGNMFDDDAEPQIFLVTRGERPWDMAQYGTVGDYNLITLIRSELDWWWARGPSRGLQAEITYTPIINILPSDDPEHPGTSIPQIDPRHAGDPEFFTFRGKVMVQYQPALLSCGSDKTVARKAEYRVWVEADVPVNGEKSWWPGNDDQKKSNTSKKRRESCSIDDKPNGDPDNDTDGEPDGDPDGKLGATPPSNSCGTDADCSSPDCVGGGRSSACEEGVCVCKTPPPPPPKKTCSSDNDCSGPECAGHMTIYKCEDEVCVCKSPQNPSICSTVATCDYLECDEDEERACKGGTCECQEKTCSDADECHFLSCDEDAERACKNAKCECQEKTCSNADQCHFLSCEKDEAKACSESKCVCKDEPPPFAPGTCTTHIREYGNKDNFATSIQIYDGEGTNIGGYEKANKKHNWGDMITVSKDKLPYDIKYEFLEEWLGEKNKRDRPAPGSLGPDPLLYTTYSVRITADGTTWSTEDDDRKELPRCEVGNWDTHGTWNPNEIISDFIDGLMGDSGELPTRDMDCRWKC